jgi:hypothetical protein
MWSNRETRELYAHLALPTEVWLAKDVLKLVADALDDVRSEPELWGDFERQAVRALSATLRAHVEGLFEGFYFGPESKRTREIARMCSDVGSLWRVNWHEIAERLFEDGGHKLEPPE